MNDDKNREEQERKYHIAGWVLFILCAIVYIASGIKNHDTLTIVGSVIFLIACIVFLLPLINRNG